MARAITETQRNPRYLTFTNLAGVSATTIEEAPFAMPEDEPLLLASYRTGDDGVGLSPVAYLEPFRVGAALLDMAAWLDLEESV